MTLHSEIYTELYIGKQLKCEPKLSITNMQAPKVYTWANFHFEKLPYKQSTHQGKHIKRNIQKKNIVFEIFKQNQNLNAANPNLQWEIYI